MPTDDTLPPDGPHDRETLDELPPAANDTDPPPDSFGVPEALRTEPVPESSPALLAIPRGEATNAVRSALLDMHRCLLILEATAMAAARALDLQEDQQ